MSEHPEHQSKQESMREALEDVRRRTWAMGETWPLVEAALSDVGEQKEKKIVPGG